MSANTDTGLAAFFTQNARFRLVRTGEGADGLVGIGFEERSETFAGSLGVGVRGTHAGEGYPEYYQPDRRGKEYEEARRTVDLKEEIGGKRMEDLIEKVVDALHIQIIGESYRQYFPRSTGKEGNYLLRVPAGSTTIERILDTVMWVNRWWKRGSVYLFQRPQWWIDRRSEVLDATIARLKEILKRHPLTLR